MTEIRGKIGVIIDRIGEIELLQAFHVGPALCRGQLDEVRLMEESRHALAPQSAVLGRITRFDRRDAQVGHGDRIPLSRL